jgi:peroxiredoxin
MKVKIIILFALVAAAALVIFFLPEDKVYEEVAEVGSPAPDFELLDSNGKSWRLSGQRGKVLFINFWATWCSVCKTEIPHKESLSKKMEGKPFQMFGMLFRDDPENLIPFIEEHNITSPTLIDPDNKVAKIFGITGVPETFIIDREGIIREKIVGPRVWDNPENMAVIEKWL